MDFPLSAIHFGVPHLWKPHIGLHVGLNMFSVCSKKTMKMTYRGDVTLIYSEDLLYFLGYQWGLVLNQPVDDCMFSTNHGITLQGGGPPITNGLIIPMNLFTYMYIYIYIYIYIMYHLYLTCISPVNHL